MDERPQNRNLKRTAGPGRPKDVPPPPPGAGAVAIARWICDDPRYLKSLKRRIIDGKAPNAELTMLYYAFGKPLERVEHKITLLEQLQRLDEMSDLELQAFLAELRAGRKHGDGKGSRWRPGT